MQFPRDFRASTRVFSFQAKKCIILPTFIFLAWLDSRAHPPALRVAAAPHTAKVNAKMFVQGVSATVTVASCHLSLRSARSEQSIIDSISESSPSYSCHTQCPYYLVLYMQSVRIR